MAACLGHGIKGGFLARLPVFEVDIWPRVMIMAAIPAARFPLTVLGGAALVCPLRRSFAGPTQTKRKLHVH